MKPKQKKNRLQKRIDAYEYAIKNDSKFAFAAATGAVKRPGSAKKS